MKKIFLTIGLIGFFLPLVVDETILGAFRESFPHLFWFLVIIGFVSVASFMVAKLHSRFMAVENDVDTLKADVNTLKTDVADIKQRLNGMDKKLDAIIAFLAKHGFDFKT